MERARELNNNIESALVSQLDEAEEDRTASERRRAQGDASALHGAMTGKRKTTP